MFGEQTDRPVKNGLKATFDLKDTALAPRNHAGRKALGFRTRGPGAGTDRVQELCESRGGRPGLSVLMNLTVSVDVKQHWTVLRHWAQFVPNMSTDIRGHEALHQHHQLVQTTGFISS